MTRSSGCATSRFSSAATFMRGDHLSVFRRLSLGTPSRASRGQARAPLLYYGLIEITTASTRFFRDSSWIARCSSRSTARVSTRNRCSPSPLESGGRARLLCRRGRSGNTFPRSARVSSIAMRSSAASGACSTLSIPRRARRHVRASRPCHFSFDAHDADAVAINVSRDARVLVSLRIRAGPYPP